MPVKLTQSSLLQMLLRTSNVLTLRQVIDILGARPAAREDLRLGQRERPFQIWDVAGIYGLAAESIWVLEIKLMIRPACRSLVKWQGL